MKSNTTYISALLLGAAALSSCNDNFERPPMVYPTTDLKANAELSQIKAQYWSTERNNVSSIGFLNQLSGNDAQAADSIIISGRVISESASGNIYNSIVIQGDGCALNISVRTNKLTAIPQFGQEIMVKVTGQKIGNYNGLMQLGAEGVYNGAPSMTFLESADFEKIFAMNGAPRADLVDTVLLTLPEISSKSVEVLQKYQSQLVRFDGLTFEEPGKPFAGSSNTDRYAKDASGNRINVRTSAYATFKNDLVPSGTGSVVGILSYYGSDWQLLLNDITGIIGFDGTDTPVTPPAGEGEGDGTADSPFNTVKALAFTQALGADAETEQNYYVQGTVTSIKELSTQYGNATYTITSEGTSTGFDIFRGMYLDGAKFTADDQLKVGDKVVVCGKLVNFKGNTPQMAQGSKLITINGQGGSGPDTPGGDESTIFSSLDASSAQLPAGWTIENGTLPEGLEYVWSWKVYQEKGYLNASAYVGGTNYSVEAYAVSPEIDLTGATGVSMAFEHAAKFQTTLRTLCGVAVREAGATAWTSLDIPVWPDAGAWTFVNSGLVSLEAYAGKKIQIAFRYGSSTDGADTWEIKNLVVTGKK